ncbi:hypothetical protein C8A03DRAFT_46836 [Achaetomium macrosporum]|uniref:Uncharacterized protein n=1 Tax=Achaetomium macrosporum TaxID=79813 RepID=A0AAN7C543_9PEZI|nr:hypothetical protein C8A03DRAFT_46836 [Achaetomium macrosporum]
MKFIRLLGYASNFPPEFWDNLSKVPLTRRALRELDRRNRTRPVLAAAETFPTDLTQFARRRGPDLRHLRAVSHLSAASSNRRTKSTKATQVANTSRARRTSVYDDAFEQCMIDHGIYPHDYEHADGRPKPVPHNVDQVRSELKARRALLSLSRFPELAFDDFTSKNKQVSGGTLGVIPIMVGSSDILSNGGLSFTNIDSITGGTTVNAKPDLFDGARAEHINLKIRDPDEEGDIATLIIPTKHAGVPVLPNFFLEGDAYDAKATPAVAVRQALHDGAIGARAMHAYRIMAAAYHAGTGWLSLYAHHTTPSAAPGANPESHMTRLRNFALADSHEALVQGLTAFRNARDLAQRHRDRFIQAANARAPRLKNRTPAMSPIRDLLLAGIAQLEAPRNTRLESASTLSLITVCHGAGRW